jgi:hypothetical protein
MYKKHKNILTYIPSVAALKPNSTLNLILSILNHIWQIITSTVQLCHSVV